MSDGNAAPIIAGLAIGSAFVIFFALFSTIPIKCGAPGLQLAPLPEETRIGIADMIVYGTVLSAELEPVYYMEFGELRTNLRYVVTILAEDYLKDTTGKQSAIITFREDGFGCAYLFSSEVYNDNPYAVEHTRGEKAIFLISKLDTPHLGEIEGGWYAFSLFDKYALVGEDDNGNNLVQNKWNARQGEKPVPITQLESKISSVIETNR